MANDLFRYSHCWEVAFLQITLSSCLCLRRLNVVECSRLIVKLSRSDATRQRPVFRLEPTPSGDIAKYWARSQSDRAGSQSHRLSVCICIDFHTWLWTVHVDGLWNRRCQNRWICPVDFRPPEMIFRHAINRFKVGFVFLNIVGKRLQNDWTRITRQRHVLVNTICLYEWTKYVADVQHETE